MTPASPAVPALTPPVAMPAAPALPIATPVATTRKARELTDPFALTTDRARARTQRLAPQAAELQDPFAPDLRPRAGKTVQNRAGIGPEPIDPFAG